MLMSWYLSEELPALTTKIIMICKFLSELISDSAAQDLPDAAVFAYTIIYHFPGNASLFCKFCENSKKSTKRSLFLQILCERGKKYLKNIEFYEKR